MNVMNGSAPDLLRTFLEGRDIACPGCGYNLRDLRGVRCPECGDELLLRVGLAEPKQAASIAALIGLAAGGGLNGLLLGYLAIRYFFFPFYGGFGRFLAFNAGGLVVQAIATAVLLLCWRKVRRLSQLGKWAVVISCWGLTIADLIIFSTTVR